MGSSQRITAAICTVLLTTGAIIVTESLLPVIPAFFLGVMIMTIRDDEDSQNSNHNSPTSSLSLYLFGNENTTEENEALSDDAENPAATSPGMGSSSSRQ